MFHKGKLLVFLVSSLIVLYGISAAFYGKVVAKDEAYRELSVFIESLRKVTDDYVEPPDSNKLQEGAMRGLIEALDPYSSFLSKEQMEALEKRRANANAGVGVVLSKRADLIYVVTTRAKGAAEKAGVRPGDYVVAVDGTSVEDKSILEADSLLRGAEGSKVKVTLYRTSRTKPVDIEITREAEAAVPVSSHIRDNNVGLLEVPSLAQPAIDQVRVNLKRLISAGAQKLVLDVRDCADGNLSDGGELANFFIREGLLYYGQNRKGEKVEEVKADSEKFITDLPLVVLINNSTAGAAEIAAGALKDHQRGILVGGKSFGMGSSQTRIPLKSGAILILSTVKIYTPGGKMIQEENMRHGGIKPNVQAPDDERHQDFLVESFYDDQDDAGKYKSLRERIAKEQLEKALEILSKAQVPAKRAA